MKKTIMSGILISAMILGLAACSQSGSSTQSSVAASIDTAAAKQELEQKEEAATTAAAQTEAQTTATAEEPSSAAFVPDDTIHGFGGGASGGGYYTISNVLSQYFTDQGFGKFSAQPTTGGTQNALLMQEGSLDIAVINGADSLGAYTGTTESFSEPYTDLRAIAVLYSGCMQFIVKNTDEINCINDLKGRRVGVGAAGSGDLNHSKRVYKAAGMDLEKDIDPQYIGTGEASTQLQDGQIDGFLNVASLPFAAVTELTSSGKGKLIGLTDEEVAALTTKEDSVYFAYTIPANIYKDQTEEIQSVALPTVLCVDANRISDELAYEITKNLYENVAEVNDLYAGFDLDPQKTIDALKIPLHDGAKKYYEEIGY